MKGLNYTPKGLDNARKGPRNNTSCKHLESVHSVGSGPDAPGRVYISPALPHWPSRLRAQDMFCRGWVSRLVGASDVGLTLTGGGLMNRVGKHPDNVLPPGKGNAQRAAGGIVHKISTIPYGRPREA